MQTIQDPKQCRTAFIQMTIQLDLPVYPGTIFSTSFWSPQLWVLLASSLDLEAESGRMGRMSVRTSLPELATPGFLSKLQVVLPKVSPIWYLNWGQKPPYLKYRREKQNNLALFLRSSESC